MTQTTDPESIQFDPADDLTYAALFGDHVAPVYDYMYPPGPVDEQCAEFIHQLAGDGSSVLELGVGTGRLALPMAAKGLRVHGVDASPAMLAKLAERDPAGTIAVTRQTFTGYALDERFDLIVAPFNALCCLQSADEQLAALHTASRHLKPGGSLVVETFEPARQHGQQQAEMITYPFGPNSVVLESLQTVRALQLIFVTNTIFDEQSAPTVAATFLRYVWPSELDQMAARAGLRLTDRYSGWQRQPVDDNSTAYVSVFTPATE